MVEKTSMMSANRLAEIQRSLEKTVQRVASGKQILSASDDAAGLAMAMAIESQARSLTGQIANRQDEISLLQTAEGGMSQIGEMTQRIRELSVQAANGTLTTEDRQAIQAEIAQLNAGIDQISGSTNYNTKPLLDGSLNIQLQNGNRFAVPALDSATLGTSAIDVTTVNGANAAMTAAGRAGESVVSERSRVGAITNGITSEIAGLQQELMNALSAQSRISDVDMAQAVLQMTTQQLQQEATMRVFKIDEASRSKVLQLLS
ncbi:MAG TPA: flagellin [Candidatus Ozemobacteraceae bacterium]|nr:flagellin [Candidatus Ozemobacteraceae bacterium]HQG26996.1 flagellin [Candidatus Ozemobacteraceae bacterium]